MKQISAAPILAELSNPSSLDAQAAALRALKNEIIGHQQRKELWIKHGVIAPLARILDKQRSSAPSWQDTQTRGGRPVQSQTASDEDVLIQAIIIIGSLAQGGPQYMSPLAACQIMTPLASLLNPASSSPSAVLASLRALNTIADSAALEQQPGSENDDWVVKALYTDQNLGYLAEILGQDSPALVVQQQISLAANLVSKTCQEESCRKQLASFGVLEALAHRMASFVVLSAEQKHQEQRLPGSPPKFSIRPATSRARLAPVLQAVGTIITSSGNRVTQFLRAPAFAAVFQYSELEGWKITPRPKSPSGNGYSGSETLAPLKSSPSQATSFPPLGEMARWGKSKPSKGLATTGNGTGSATAPLTEDEETPLAGWLALVIQTEQGVTRLMASWLLAILFREYRTSQTREKILSMQLIPLLVRLLEADNTFPTNVAPSYDDSVIQPPRWLIKRLAPQVLGLLVGESELLQRAAFEAGVIKKLSQMLKQTFDPLPTHESLQYWNPEAEPEEPTMGDYPRAMCTLGPQGLTPSAFQVLQTRASVIGAIASMATRSDDYRKTIINNGVVPYLIAALKSSSSPIAPTPEAEGNKFDSMVNPTPVLMQACAAATALSRSVSTLRTSLIEAGLATPVFQLLQHADIRVQIAATGAVCNIVLEFSPMRQQDIVDAGVLTTLCKHAHSTNSQLRLNSLWALKHLVHSANNKLKMECVEELGAGWLKQIICNATEDRSASAPLAMGSSNAAGEQVDLLNAVDSASFESGTDVADEDEVHMVDSIEHLSRPSGDKAMQGSPGKDTLRDEGADRAARARRDDVLVQEQGLDLMRNLLSGNGSGDMIDYVFQELGQDTLFSIFASLLRARPGTSSEFGASGSSGANKTPPPHPEIVLSVVFIFVHLATGYPRHRQLLLAQAELMRLFVPLSVHPSSPVRMAYCWVLINLMWVDDTGDKQGARNRALELRKLGIEERLETLQKDADLDVQERAKQAAASMHDLLKGGA